MTVLNHLYLKAFGDQKTNTELSQITQIFSLHGICVFEKRIGTENLVHKLGTEHLLTECYGLGVQSHTACFSGQGENLPVPQFLRL